MFLYTSIEAAVAVIAGILLAVCTKKEAEVTYTKSCPFVLWIGSKRLIKRRKLDEYIDRMYSI